MLRNLARCPLPTSALDDDLSLERVTKSNSNASRIMVDKKQKHYVIETEKRKLLVLRKEKGERKIDSAAYALI